MEAIYILGALGSALASLWAAILAVLFANTQMAVDPTTHQDVYLPWWAMFRGGEAVPVLGFSLAAVGFGWLAWYLCRQAYRLGPWV